MKSFKELNEASRTSAAGWINVLTRDAELLSDDIADLKFYNTNTIDSLQRGRVAKETQGKIKEILKEMGIMKTQLKDLSAAIKEENK
jgi:hypothetical protein